MGPILVKRALNAFKIEVFKKHASKLNLFYEKKLKTSIFKAFKALFTKIIPSFCQLTLEFW